MKTAFVLGSVSRNNGGVFEAARHLARGLHEIERDSVEVFGLRDEFTDADGGTWSPVRVRAFDPLPPRSLGYARGFQRALHDSDPSVCHVHGLWQFPGAAARRFSEKRKRPLIISIHGMLDPWAVANSRWKKRLALALWERRNLAHAACLHAITSAEVAAIRNFGLPNPIALIPNGVEIPNAKTMERAPWGSSIPQNSRVLLYFGRIHPKKGLATLIEGWVQISANAHGWVLAIAGWDQGGHVDELRALSNRLKTSVHFAGPQFGPQKDAAYANADAVILPSLSEGLPLVVLEAWAHRRPVLMTAACNLPSGFAQRAAVQIEPDASNIAMVLTEFFKRDDAERAAMGERGRQLVERDYAWPRVAAEMRDVYAWLSQGAPRPKSIVD